jgi:hypothetical protein
MNYLNLLSTILITAAPIAVFAQSSTSTEAGFCTDCATGSSDTKQTTAGLGKLNDHLETYRFTAVEYFEAGAKHNPKWPKKLTFEPVDITAEQLEKELPGVWASTYTCDGRKPDHSTVRSWESEGTYGGLDSPSTMFHFFTDESGAAKFERLMRPGLNEKDGKTEVEETGTYSAKPNPNGLFVHMQGFEPKTFRSVRVRETGEVIMQITYPLRRCPDGTKAKVNLSKVPLS